MGVWKNNQKSIVDECASHVTLFIQALSLELAEFLSLPLVSCFFLECFWVFFNTISPIILLSANEAEMKNISDLRSDTGYSSRRMDVSNGNKTRPFNLMLFSNVKEIKHVLNSTRISFNTETTLSSYAILWQFSLL